MTSFPSKTGASPCPSCLRALGACFSQRRCCAAFIALCIIAALAALRTRSLNTPLKRRTSSILANLFGHALGRGEMIARRLTSASWARIHLGIRWMTSRRMNGSMVNLFASRD